MRFLSRSRMEYVVCSIGTLLVVVAGCGTTHTSAEGGRSISHAIERMLTADITIVVVNGADPVRAAGIDDFLQKFRDAGYCQLILREWFEPILIEKEIRAIHTRCPDAKIALIGYSAGAYTVKRMANRLLRDGIGIVLVGYIGGDYLSDTVETQVRCSRVVNITGDGHLLSGKNLFFNGTEISGARNIRLNGTRHFQLLRHPMTFSTISEELAGAVGIRP